MKIYFKNWLIKLYKSSWFITLFATTLGVLLAFYLNDLSSRSKIEDRKQVSIQNITNELLNNKTELTDSENNERLIEFLTKVRDINDEIPNELITTIGFMNTLSKNYSDFMVIQDSIKIDETNYKYDIAYRFNLILDDLQNIAWEAFKMSDITNELDYSCLQVLVKIYSLQEIYINEQQKILDYFVNAEHTKLLSALQITKQLEYQLLNTTREGLEEITNCN